jgi:iron-sulfur cluster assembly protein
MTEPTTAEIEAPAPPRITLTEKAAEYMKTKLELQGRPGAALRIGVRGGGCNGLTYVTEISDGPPRPRDIVYDFHGLPVFVDDRSLHFIEGSVIDLEMTLMYQGLRFKNPLEASSCGCGETFSVKDEVLQAMRATR